MLVVAGLVAVLLVGCADDDATDPPRATPTRTVTETVTATGTPTTAATASPLPSTSATGATPSPPHPDKAPDLSLTATGVTYFETPSGNIRCFLTWYDARGVECSLVEKDFADPPRPPGCQTDWSPQFDLTTEARYGACRGDVTGEPTGRVLDYGARAVNGPISCLSQQSGLSCSNRRTGHGFELSRADYQLS